jgi:hypothetical protein
MENQELISVILGSSLLSGLFSAVLTQAVQTWLKSRELSKAVKFAALNLSHELESYANGCMEQLTEDDMDRQSRGAAGAIAEIPDFSIPKDDFSKFDPDIVDQLFSLPKHIRSARNEIDFISGTAGDHDEARKITIRHVKELGLLSLDLSIEVRKRYKLPSRIVKYGTSMTLFKALRSSAK